MPSPPVITSLHFYPVKSCRAVDLDIAYAGPRGFSVGKILDRSWMVIGDKNVLISQRQEPALAQVKVELIIGQDGIAEKLRLSVDGMQPVILDPSSVSDERQSVVIHGKAVISHLAAPEISQWFSDFLRKPVRTVYQKDEDVRLCDPHFATNPGTDSVSFADGYPYLVVTQATLEKLNGHMENGVPMQRFRPNIVIQNTEPDAEYTWRDITAGEARFSIVKPCTRCVMTTIDQETGIKTGKEPLATLAMTAFLAQEFGGTRVQGAVFGENAIATVYGKISVGDTIEIVESKPMYAFRAAEKMARI